MTSTNPTPLTPQILILALYLSIMWGIYLAYTIREWLRIRAMPTRRRGEIIGTFRRLVVAFCLWTFPASVFLRTGLVLLGFGEATSGQILFFSLAGTSVLGSIIVVISLKLD